MTGSRRTRAALLANLAVGTAVLICWALLVGTDGSLAQYLGLAVVAVGGLVTSISVVAKAAGPLQLTFWAFVVVWAGFAPLLQLRDNQLPWPDSPLPQLAAPAQLLLLSALVAYSLGLGLSARGSLGRQPLDDPQTEPDQPRILLGLCLLCVFTMVSLSQAGGFAGRFASRDAFNSELADAGISYSGGQSIQLALIKLAPAAVAGAFAYIAARTSRGRRLDSPLAKPAIVLAALTGIALLANPISSTRFISFSVILCGVFGLIRLRSLGAQAVTAISLVFGLAIVYPVSAIFKLGTDTGVPVNVGLKAFLTVDFDGYQQTLNSLYYVQMNGHTDGLLTASALGFWVPRSIWTAKSLPGSFAVAESRNYPFGNLSLPLWSELYVDLGLVGMLLLMGMIGYLTMRLDHAFITRGTGPASALCAVMAAGQIGFLRGPLGAQIPFFASLIFFTAVLARQGGASHRVAKGVKRKVPEMAEGSVS